MINVLPLRQEAGEVTLSAVVPVTGRYDDPETVYRGYRRALEATGHAYELIYVLDARFPQLEAQLRALQAQGEPLSVITLTRNFGEAVSLQVGFQRARGDLLLMLPPYLQVEPDGIPAIVAALERADLVAACRDRSGDHWASRLRNGALQRLAHLAGSPTQDMGCLVRAFRRRVLEDVLLQGEHHRFLPLLAQNAGFVVEQMTLPQAASDRRFRMHGPSVYLGRLLDVIAVAFLLRFMQRPFRFFGTIGFIMAAIGVALGSVLVVQRLVFHVALADRPALLLATLLVVLGIQIGAVGLIAEIIIFTRSGRMNTFHVDRVVEHEESAPATGTPSGRPAQR